MKESLAAAEVNCASQGTPSLACITGCTLIPPSYLENGVLPNGEGNMNSITPSATFFELGSDKPSTTQWGSAIQMPMLLGLPVDSEVNLVVASEAGLTSEISSVIPYLYNIRYFKTSL